MNKLSNERLREKLRAANALLSHEHADVRIHAQGNIAVLTELLAYREAQGNIIGWKWRIVDAVSGETSAWRVCLLPLQPGGGAGFETESIPLYAAPPLPVVPDGWALVPIEATPEMLIASWTHHGIHAPNAWRTMLAAAPKQSSET